MLHDDSTQHHSHHIISQSLTPSGGERSISTGATTGKRKLRPILAGLLATLGLILTGVVSYRSWRRKILARILHESVLVETAIGPVEYQVTGQGHAVIYAHGTPGGYEQGLAFASFLESQDCMFISPSRPGYLRTPLSSGASPEAQADLYAALLDTLHIKRASIIGFSGGGPSALQFALRHPERCCGLVMIGGISQRYDKQERLRALPFWQRFITRLVDYLLIFDPFLYITGPITASLPYGTSAVGMLNSGAHYYLRKAGYENDMQQFTYMGAYPLEQIGAPTLIIHGTEDHDVPFSNAQALAQRIPNARLLALKGNHAAFYNHAPTVMPQVRAFLIDNTAPVC